MTRPARNILVVDDEAAIRNSFQTALVTAPYRTSKLDALEKSLFGANDAAENPQPSDQYNVVCCAQGEEAISKVAEAIATQDPFGVVFLDMRMPPGIDGAETAKRIRGIDPLVNIVIVTGYSDTEIADLAKSVLPADKLFFVAKPIQVSEIRQQAAALSARWIAELSMMETLRTRNAELEAAIIAATKAREQAEQANAAKSAFLANISHELRTPLNAVLGFSEILANESYGPLGDARYADYSKEIHSSGQTLLQAINDIIDTARIDVGSIELHYEELNFLEAVSRSVSVASTGAAPKWISFSPLPPSLPIPVRADAKRLTQILTEILRNAVKFSPRSGHIDIGLEVKEPWVRLSVKDQGPGISEAAIQAAHRPFYSEHGVLSREHGGLGLGLWLARRLTELQGGALHIEGVKDQGTTVTVEFPLSIGTRDNH